MNRDTARARVQFHLGKRTDLANDIVDKFQDIQIRLEQKPDLPWFLLTEYATIDTAIGEERIALPNDFLREAEEDFLYIFNSGVVNVEDEYTALLKEDVSFLRWKYPGTGTPVGYDVIGTYIRLFPTPDAIVTLKMLYYARAALLTTNIENSWLKYVPDLFIGLAGLEIAQVIGNRNAVAVFTGLSTTANAALETDSEQREHVGRRYVMGGDN